MGKLDRKMVMNINEELLWEGKTSERWERVKEGEWEENIMKVHYGLA
jgi:hypothetical protein